MLKEKFKIIGQLWQKNPARRARVFFAALFLFAILSGVTGCKTTGPAPLRVGVSPDYPPLVYQQSDGMAGAEVDFAVALGRQLGRPVGFVPMRFERLIPALQDGKIDIIMSGMSITEGRKLRVVFSDPYLTNQIRAIFRRQDAGQFKTRDDILRTGARIGIVPGTTSDVFVQQYCTNATRVVIGTRQDAAFYLLQDKRIDVFVDDTFALGQTLSQNEASLGFLREPLAEDNLAWAVRPDNQELLNQVNAALAQWKSDGTLDKILLRWIPYLKKYEASE